jgi:hypothetical protein
MTMTTVTNAQRAARPRPDVPRTFSETLDFRLAGYARTIGEALGDEERDRLLALWKADLAAFKAMDAEAQRIRTSRDLAPAGKTKAMAALTERANALLAKLHAEHAKTMIKLRETEDMASDGIVPDPTSTGAYLHTRRVEPSVEGALLAREVRDLLRTVSPLERAQRYLAAVAVGDDPALVAAVEGAPKAFPLVEEATLAKAREIRINASPWYEGIVRMRTVARANEALLDGLRREMLK